MSSRRARIWFGRFVVLLKMGMRTGAGSEDSGMGRVQTAMRDCSCQCTTSLGPELVCLTILVGNFHLAALPALPGNGIAYSS